MILDPSQTGDAPIRVRNGWEYVDALKEAETPAQFPLNIIIEDDIILLEEHLGNKGVFADYLTKMGMEWTVNIVRLLCLDSV